MINQGPAATREAVWDEAAEWLVECRTGVMDPHAREAFDSWLRASEDHLRAFMEMAAIWGYTGALEFPEEASLDQLITRVKQQSNVVELNIKAAESIRRTRPSRNSPQSVRREPRSNRYSATLAASLTVVILGAALAWWHSQGQHTYVTDIGEQRSIKLEDGSVITLDSGSELRVSFTKQSRAMELVKGQALFDAAKDLSRPFTVRSAGAVVRALGTQFDINQNRTGVVVTVLEGSVAVYSPPVQRNDGAHPAAFQADAAIPAQVLVSAGEQLHIAAGKAAQPVRTDVTATTAWTQRQLVLEAATWKEAAEQFNRYNLRKLVVEDQGNPPLRISGVFGTTPDFLLQHLKQRPDIQIWDAGSEIHVMRRP